MFFFSFLYNFLLQLKSTKGTIKLYIVCSCASPTRTRGSSIFKNCVQQENILSVGAWRNFFGKNKILNKGQNFC